jgi:hypothetical protein
MAFIPYLIGLLAAGVAIGLANLGVSTYTATHTPYCISTPAATPTAPASAKGS